MLRALAVCSTPSLAVRCAPLASRLPPASSPPRTPLRCTLRRGPPWRATPPSPRPAPSSPLAAAPAPRLVGRSRGPSQSASALPEAPLPAAAQVAAAALLAPLLTVQRGAQPRAWPSRHFHFWLHGWWGGAPARASSCCCATGTPQMPPVRWSTNLLTASSEGGGAVCGLVLMSTSSTAPTLLASVASALACVITTSDATAESPSLSLRPHPLRRDAVCGIVVQHCPAARASCWAGS